jgi:hypothetical protein
MEDTGEEEKGGQSAVLEDRKVEDMCPAENERILRLVAVNLSDHAENSCTDICKYINNGLAAGSLSHLRRALLALCPTFWLLLSA